MRTVIGLAALWSGFSALALRSWRSDRAAVQRDEHLRRLLAGGVVPGPRATSEGARGDRTPTY
jgi:hypothetical protein